MNLSTIGELAIHVPQYFLEICFDHFHIKQRTAQINKTKPIHH